MMGTGSGAPEKLTPFTDGIGVASPGAARTSQWPMAGTRHTVTARSRAAMAVNPATVNAAAASSVCWPPTQLSSTAWAATEPTGRACAHGWLARTAVGQATWARSRLAWVATTPLGRSVVPEVNTTSAASPGPTSAARGPVGCPAPRSSPARTTRATR